jgi:hypothetical protein
VLQFGCIIGLFAGIGWYLGMVDEIVSKLRLILRNLDMVADGTGEAVRCGSIVQNFVTAESTARYLALSSEGTWDLRL